MSTALCYLLVSIVAVLQWLAAAAATDRAALNCTTATYVNVAALISSAGHYDVSCTESLEWYVWIVGCAGNGSLVSIRLLHSSTQVLVTDNATLFTNTSLMCCILQCMSTHFVTTSNNH